MSLLSSRQVRFVSSTVAILLGYQSWAIASPNRHNTPPNDLVPLLLAQNNEVLFPNPDVRIDGQPVRPSRIESAPPFQQRAVAPPSVIYPFLIQLSILKALVLVQMLSFLA
nr:hypothetical protein [Cyanobacterium sp. IPPAS B-1200]